MRNSDLTVLVDYLYWMRDRIIKASRDAPAAFIDKHPVTIRDLRSTLVHELDVEWSWRQRLQGAPAETWGPEAELKPGDYPTVDAVDEHWRRDEEEMRRWVASLSDEDLTTAWEMGLPLWYHLLHIITHGVLQIADAAVLLTRAGHSPGELDFLEFADPRP